MFKYSDKNKVKANFFFCHLPICFRSSLELLNIHFTISSLSYSMRLTMIKYSYREYYQGSDFNMKANVKRRSVYAILLHTCQKSDGSTFLIY